MTYSVSSSFRHDTELRELGEDFAMLSELSKRIKAVDAFATTLAAYGNSAQTRKVCHDMQQILADVLHDVSWHSHLAGAEVAAEETGCRDVVEFKDIDWPKIEAAATQDAIDAAKLVQGRVLTLVQK